MYEIISGLYPFSIGFETVKEKKYIWIWMETENFFFLHKKISSCFSFWFTFNNDDDGANNGHRMTSLYVFALLFSQTKKNLDDDDDDEKIDDE